jgi:hypothetical protein
MKYCILLFSALVFISAGSFTQQKDLMFKNTVLIDSKKSGTGNTIILGSVLLISPTLVLEGGKAHFGLSKEFSAGKFPYGRAELDYTYIFRNERTSTINISYNLDIPFNGSFKHPSLFMFSPGGGYYTDFTYKGYFAQLAIGFWAGVGFSESMSIHPNIKVRKVFMNDNQPDVFTVSLGVGFGFYTQ